MIRALWNLIVFTAFTLTVGFCQMIYPVNIRLSSAFSSIQPNFPKVRSNEVFEYEDKWRLYDTSLN